MSSLTKKNYFMDVGQSLLLGIIISLLFVVAFVVSGFEITTERSSLFFFLFSFVVGYFAAFIAIFKWKNY